MMEKDQDIQQQPLETPPEASEVSGAGAPAPEPQIDPFGIGESEPLGPNVSLPAEIQNQALIQQYRATVQGLISQAGSKREVLEIEIDSLSECVGVAAEIYKTHPHPDNSYMLAALQNAKNSALGQWEKMKDPKLTLAEIENHIKDMFTALVRGMVLEIDKTRREFHKQYPQDKTTVEDVFNRMLGAISPEANKLYDGLHEILKRSLGIKK